MMKFSQGQESEADQKGFELMKKSKISPLGFIDFFKRAKTKKDVLPEQVKNTLSIFSTHPPDDNRIKSINELFLKNPFIPEKIEVNWDETKAALKMYLNK